MSDDAFQLSFRRRLLLALLPSRFFFADDRLTDSATRLLRRLLMGAAFLLLAAIAIGLLNRENWREVSAGALFAWSVSGILWAINSYRSGSEATLSRLRHVAEQDLLYARLNHLANQLGTPLLNINEGDLDGAINFRIERLAHLYGLEEFRADGYTTETGEEFWDNIGCGYPSGNG